MVLIVPPNWPKDAVLTSFSSLLVSAKSCRMAPASLLVLSDS
jgi:hypothetical protein